MAGWILVPCLVSLREEFNQLAPKRDKASDGSIGNLAHQQESSDHNPDETGRTPYSDADKVNEVHAIDVDNDGPWPTGVTFDKCIQVLVERHRSGKDDRLQNIIWNRRIWSRSWGWTARAYTGASAHTEHGHFSARYTTAQESDTRSWGLLDLIKEHDMATAEEIATAVWAKPITSDWLKVEKRTAADWLKYADACRRDVASTRADLQTIGKALLAAISANHGAGDVDEDAIIAGVLAGISPEKIVALIPQSIAQEVVDQLAARIAA